MPQDTINDATVPKVGKKLLLASRACAQAGGITWDPGSRAEPCEGAIGRPEGLSRAIGFQISLSFLWAVSKAAAVAIPCQRESRAQVTSHASEKMPRGCCG